MNELECIRTFVKVVEVGNFTEAGRQTNSVKSAVTKRIKQLEDHLELQLFQRSTRKLAITEAGTMFYQRCIHILADLDQAKSDVSTLEWSLSGTFRVSCISSFIQTYLADDLSRFRLEHPDLQVDLSSHDRYCDPVKEGFDLSIHAAPSHGEVLERVEIAPIKRLIVASPTYLEKYGIPKRPEDLKDCSLAHNSHVQSTSLMNFESDKGVDSIPFKAAVLTNTMSVLHSAVMSGECLAMLPIFFIENEIISGQFVPVLTDYRIKKADLAAFYRKSDFVPMKVKIFLNSLKRKYGNSPPWEQRLLKQKPELSYALGIDP